jgi:peptidoglycan/LPS O-acetylase OafA/YrhL
MTLGSAPYFAWMAIYIAAMTVVARKASFFSGLIRRIDTAPSYNVPLEGLRGWLAISVFFHHAVITYYFFTTGAWSVPPSRFFTHLGPSSVYLFFHLTGFLFWSKLARGTSIMRWSFFRARARRLFPAYYLSVALVFLVVAVRTGFELREPALRVLGEAAQWLTFAPLAEFPALNGYADTTIINAAVLWTLRVEWLFYLLLPLFSWFARDRRLFALLVIMILVYAPLRMLARGTWLGDVPTVAPAALSLQAFLHTVLTGFAPGAVFAVLDRRWPQLRQLASQRWFSLVPLLALGTMVTFVDAGSNATVPFLALAFGSVALGADIFGLLRQPGVLLLGLISYSTYVLHGIVLYVSSQLTDRAIDLAAIGLIPYWALVGLFGGLVLAVSLLSFRYVEYPLLRPQHAASGASEPRHAPRGAIPTAGSGVVD